MVLKLFTDKIYNYISRCNKIAYPDVYELNHSQR